MLPEEEEDQENVDGGSNVNKEDNVANMDNTQLLNTSIQGSSSKPEQNVPNPTEMISPCNPNPNPKHNCNPNPSPEAGNIIDFNPEIGTKTKGSAGKQLPMVASSPSNQPLKVTKENLNNLFIPKPIQNQMVQQTDGIQEDEQCERGGKDLDAESTAQKFMNTAKQGDISPRLMDKAKSIGRWRKKQ